jgi:hypothetical protein
LRQSNYWSILNKTAEKCTKYERRKYIQKCWHPVKTWRMVKTLRPVKNSVDGKNLASSENSADGKNLASSEKSVAGKNHAPIKILAPGEISASGCEEGWRGANSQIMSCFQLHLCYVQYSR